MSAATLKSPLYQMVSSTPTALWNDSCSPSELAYALEHGALGATANPVIVAGVLKKEMAQWRDRILAISAERPTANEDVIAWQVMEEMSVQGAELLLPIYHATGGHNGRLSIQVDPRNYRDADAMLAQALHFDQLAPNMIVKLPVTRAGVAAIEEVTFRGVSINATVSFTVAQALAVAEAVERGLKRREAAGQDIGHMGPVCTIMVGRVDDWLKVAVERDGLIVDPAALEWAGVAVMKRAYQLYRERGYRLRLLSAAFRNHLHWSEFIGGDVVISPPHRWQVRFNASSVPVVARIDTPVDPALVAALVELDEFRKAYDPDGLTVEQFDDYGAVRRTLRQFIAGYDGLKGMIRDLLLPDPDVG